MVQAHLQHDAIRVVGPLGSRVGQVQGGDGDPEDVKILRLKRSLAMIRSAPFPY